jgi:uncharacterized protein
VSQNITMTTAPVAAAGEASRQPADALPVPELLKTKTGERKLRRRVWIDLENSPHVPFFSPIMKRLEELDCEIVLTARDCFQVCELADLSGLKYRKVGRHYGKHTFAKILGLGIRVLQLAPFILRQKPAISVSHGSRSLVVLSALLGIPTITISDYEHADHHAMKLLGSKSKKWVMTPEVIPADIFLKNGFSPDHVLHYPGIKEDVYVPHFVPKTSPRDSFGFKATDVVVIIRPPATEAHYHNPESEKLLAEVFLMISERPDVKAILLPRTKTQEADLRQAYSGLFAEKQVIVPEHASNGLDLIWSSDLVISGGGTMNREAAALGIPVYSLFRGPLGAVDRDLADKGALIMLASVQDVRDKLRLDQRRRDRSFQAGKRSALEVVVNHIETVLENRG